MKKLFCSVDEQFVNPLFEVFDGGDFILSSYHDIEERQTQIQLFFPDEGQSEDAGRRLRDALSIVGVDAELNLVDVPDEDWKLSYRRHFKTERIGRRLLVVPTWELSDAKPSPSDVVVTLDPGMAFGTGKHETTRACLEYVDELAPEPGAAPRSFLDMGCGSGILSIAAAKLGYSPVAGFDIDADAVAASRENAEINGVRVDYREFALGKGAVTLDESIEAAKGLYPDLALQGRDCKSGSGQVFAPADVVVANILGPLLIAFAEEIAGYAKDKLVISGILTELYPEVAQAFEKLGFRELTRRTYGEWTSALLTRRA